MVVFGSDRFNSSQSDVDIAVFLPKHCTRETFFQVFEEGSREVFEDVVVVKHAFVPVVKFRYIHQTYDVVPICTNTPLKPVQSSVYTFADLVDEIDYRGFSAIVTTDVIISTIGPMRMACFQRSLEAIKTLARNEGVYSNPLGLLNGVALAVMLTSVFVTAPRERLLTPESTVAAFFETFGGDSFVHVDLLLSTPPRTTTTPRRPMQVYIPVIFPTTTTTACRINTLHNVGPAQFRRIQKFLNRAPEVARNPFGMCEYFIHFHIFASHEDFPRARTQFESTLKRVILDIGEPEWARVDVFSHEPYVFRSSEKTRASFFVGVAFEKDKLDLLLGVISNFCLTHTSHNICSDLFHRRSLPSFVQF
jgi:hypothetical protein